MVYVEFFYSHLLLYSQILEDIVDSTYTDWEIIPTTKRHFPKVFLFIPIFLNSYTRTYHLIVNNLCISHTVESEIRDTGEVGSSAQLLRGQVNILHGTYQQCGVHCKLRIRQDFFIQVLLLSSHRRLRRCQ